MKLQIKRLTETATLPTYGTDGAAGMDIYADEDVRVSCGAKPVLIHTGIAVAIPKGYVGLLVPRSGLSLRSCLRQPNCVGVIDSDYRGEIRGMFESFNCAGDERINRGDRFAQMLIVSCERCEIEEAKELDATTRGTGGFGSTGR